MTFFSDPLSPTTCIDSTSNGKKVALSFNGWKCQHTWQHLISSFLKFDGHNIIKGCKMDIYATSLLNLIPLITRL